MILRSSVSMRSAYVLASARGCARMRSSIISKAWPVAKMPTLEVVAAGNSPRRSSHALARIVDRQTKLESPSARG